MDLAGKRVMVIGLGVSGLAAARLLAARGARLVMTDLRADSRADSHSEAGGGAGSPDGSARSISAPKIRRGLKASTWWSRAPAFRPRRACSEAERRRIPVIGELELGSRFVTAPIVAVTGTNGKSTVTTLIGEIFKARGAAIFAGGNLGTPLVEAAGEEFDVVVVEVSSYQLETHRALQAARRSTSQSHRGSSRSLPDLDEYGSAKARLFRMQDARIGRFSIATIRKCGLWPLPFARRS